MSQSGSATTGPDAGPRRSRGAGLLYPALAWAVAVSVLAALVALVLAGRFDRLPLLNPFATAAVEILGCAAVVAAWVRPRGRWPFRALVTLVLASAALTAAIAGALRITGTITDPYSPWLAVSAGMVFVAVGGCPSVWRRAGRGWAGHGRRAVALVAVPLTFSGTFLLIDLKYGVWPYLGDVFAHNHIIDAAELQRLPRPGSPVDPAHPPSVSPPGRGIAVKIDPPAVRSHFGHRPGVAFLPPAYFGPRGAALPVLFLLVGSPGFPVNWLSAGRAEATDNAYASAHGGVAPVLIMVDQNGSATGDTECVDGPQGNAETYVAVDVPAYVTGTLGIVHDPDRWGVVGFSEGGTCAADLVLGHPGVYRHAVDLGGDLRPNLGNRAHTLHALFGGSRAAQDAHEPSRLLAANRYPGVSMWFEAGRDDHSRTRFAQALAALTRRAGVATHEFVVGGGHNWQFAGEAFARTMPPLCDEMRCLAAGPAR